MCVLLLGVNTPAEAGETALVVHGGRSLSGWVYVMDGTKNVGEVGILIDELAPAYDAGLAGYYDIYVWMDGLIDPGRFAGSFSADQFALLPDGSGEVALQLGALGELQVLVQPDVSPTAQPALHQLVAYVDSEGSSAWTLETMITPSISEFVTGRLGNYTLTHEHPRATGFRSPLSYSAVSQAAVSFRR